MKNTIRIGLDIDEVLARFIEGFAWMAQIHLNKTIPTDWQHWDISKSTGLSADEVDDLWRFVQTRRFWNMLSLVDKNTPALDPLRLWHFTGAADLWFITNRPYASKPPSTHVQTVEWLERHGFDHPRLIIASDKGYVAKGLQLHYFYDDRFENCRDVKTVSPDTIVMLQDEPHNREYHTNADDLNIRVVPSLMELVHAVRSDQRLSH